MSIPQQGGGPIESYDDLVGYLSSGCKPKPDWRIGTEHEKFGYCKDTLKPLPYDGPRSIRAMLEGLRDRFGWAPLEEGGNIIGLTKDGANVSLEPGGQLELSGAPVETIHQTCDEVNEHLVEVKEIADDIGAGFIGLGAAPHWSHEDMTMMPKGRYKLMTRYMGQVGTHGTQMMYRTCTVQVNLDFDVRLPDGSGTELARDLRPETTLVMVSGDSRADAVVDAWRSGARDFLLKPLDLGHLDALLSGALGTLPASSPTILGVSPEIGRLRLEIERAAACDESVLILGETGTGKELVANALHSGSPRRERPFVAINCGAIPESLIESELFGHERGSFTGAHKRHAGVFERAHRGTLFLDEVTELPLQLQVRLLRVLERGAITRVGGAEETVVDARILAACNRDPAEAVRDGILREDLLYRLHVLPIEVPPLRERVGDVAHLAQAFLQRLNERTGGAKTMSAEAIALLCAHTWPGNVRELQNVVTRAHMLAGAEIGPDSISLLQRARGALGPHDVEIGMSLDEAERRLILGTLEHLEGDKRKAAEVLGISLKTVYNRLHRYGILG